MLSSVSSGAHGTTADILDMDCKCMMMGPGGGSDTGDDDDNGSACVVFG